MNSTQNLQWQINGGVVVPVPPKAILPLELPADSECSVIRVDGKPHFHVTLIGRQALLPFQTALMKCWQSIIEAAPTIPRIEFCERLHLAKADGRKTWFLEVEDQAGLRAFVGRLSAIIDREFRKSGHAGFANSERERFFHVSVANNRGGDPFQSIGHITKP